MHAVICGAGIAGLAAAISLHRSGWQVTLVERAPSLRDGGYMIDFFGPGYDAAERIGILEALRERAADTDTVDWTDGRGRVRARIHYSRIREAMDGKLFPLLRGDVERILAAALPDAVRVHFGTTVTHVQDHHDRVDVTLEVTGSDHEALVVSADLLIGADGIGSGVRELVFGPHREYLRPLGLHTAAWFVDADDDLRAHLGGRFLMMSVPGRLVGVYEVGETQVAAFLAFLEDSADIPVDPLDEIRRRYADLGGFMPSVLAAEPVGEVYYDLVAQVRMPSWRRGRVLLIGDAAYAVSLVAGQGASLALAGGVAVGEALRGVTDPADIEPALAAFEARVRPAVESTQDGGRRTAAWFVPATRARVALRNLILIVSDLPLLARVLSPFQTVDAKGWAPVPRSGEVR
ncbi:MAG: FAD-dependent oxidoreductase [Actinomycetales bacterium]